MNLLNNRMRLQNLLSETQYGRIQKSMSDKFQGNLF